MLDYTVQILIIFVALVVSVFQKGLGKKIIPLTWGVMMIILPATWDMFAYGIVIMGLVVLLANLVETGN